MKRFSFVFTLLFLGHVSSVQASDYYFGINSGLLMQDGKINVVDDQLYPDVGINEVLEYELADDNAFSVSLFAGYALSKDLVLEIGYVKNDDLSTEIRAQKNGDDVIEKNESSYLYTAFVGIWPLQNKLAMSARLGFSVWDFDYQQETVNTTLDSDDPSYVMQTQLFSDTTTSVFWGLGLSYGVSPELELRLNLDSHSVDIGFTNLELDYDAMSVTLGLVYHL